MSHYLTKAAELLEKVSADNEKQNGKGYPALLKDGRMEVAHAYALLAAIDKGLLPEQAAENLCSRLAGGGAG
ncbi:hypothetical protein [Amycolatopsis sp. GM8]|uniref:hypothetical protein n=1 Tax=Amycolatopsis sp. GM8 TaxID=2896530 RepID=UPI001F31F9C6|nr:hypothetical protein [Amycolatopsis sp. GM8]